MEKTVGNFAKIGIGSFILSFIPSALIASLYSTFRTGFAVYKLETFDIFAFWNETPFIVGFYTQEFSIVLAIFGALGLICIVGGLILSFPKGLSSHGTARWATVPEMKRLGYLKKHKDILGAVFAKTANPDEDGLYFTNSKQPHSLITAPTRAGKGISVVIPSLLTFNGSVVALDVKGELFEHTSRARRAKGDKVYKFSPLADDGRSHCYNPLDDIVAAPKHRRFTEARRLAANFIVARGKGAEDFIGGSRDLFAAGVMLVIERGTPTIGAIFDLFSENEDKQTLFVNLGTETKSREAKAIFIKMAGNSDKTISAYTSILEDGGLGLWADTLIKSATEKSDFNVTQLRSKPASIFLIVNPNDLETLAPLMRLIFQQIVSSLQSNLPTKEEMFEVLFVLDEFKDLGKLETIESAITSIAGYGGRFMIIVQSLSNLTTLYGADGKENFLGNSGVQAFMATNDSDTPEYLSRAIGDFTRKSRTKSWSTRELTGSSIQEREEGSRLIRPEQIRVLPDNEMLILVKGQSAMRLTLIRYFEDKLFSKIYKNQSGEYVIPQLLSAVEEDDSLLQPQFIDTDHQIENDIPFDEKTKQPADVDIAIIEPPVPDGINQETEEQGIQRLNESNDDILAKLALANKKMAEID